MVREVVAYSENTNSNKAFFEIVSQIKDAAEGRKPILLIFSTSYENFYETSNDLRAAFPETVTIGMSTFISFSHKGYSKGAIQVMAIFEGIEVSEGVIFEVANYPMRHKDEVEKALAKIDGRENLMCLEFTTAFQNCEELVQDTFRAVLEKEHVPVFGGTAGADERFTVTCVSLNGVTYKEACVFVFIKNLKGKIRLYKENIYKPTNHYFTATDVDCDDRTVYEYDDTTAAEAIASALQVPIEELPEAIKNHPVGRINKDIIYITDTAKVWPDGKITYFARIYNRTHLVLLEVDDLDKVFERTAQAVRQDGPISFSIMVNCLGRSGYFLQKKKFKDFNDKLTREYGEYIGVSGYGEQLNYEHQNQTFIMAAFE